MPFIVMFTLLPKNAASTEIHAKQYEGVKRKLRLTRKYYNLTLTSFYGQTNRHS